MSDQLTLGDALAQEGIGRATAGLVPVPEETGYLASAEGHIYSVRGKYGPTEPRLLTETLTHDGYLRVRLSLGVKGKTRHQAVAPLIARAFLGPRPSPAHQVRHLDGDKTNNQASNLAWGTAKENAADRDRHGTTARGMRVWSTKASDAEVREALLLLRGGMRQRDVASRFGVRQTTVSKWARAESRREVTCHPVRVWQGVAS